MVCVLGPLVVWDVDKGDEELGAVAGVVPAVVCVLDPLVICVVGEGDEELGAVVVPGLAVVGVCDGDEVVSSLLPVVGSIGRVDVSGAGDAVVPLPPAPDEEDLLQFPLFTSDGWLQPRMS